ncbi:uncharacterized protein LOC131948291 [Physella acuta]|uniref:uncharacterized protein LOC131948291 n=1 Tax=Physella acuta TaxID=109671 RepID=UPI0027DB5E2C|nr:uncharacterized protein LOC131948291 [Physella acuta]XP_059165825.1 uncharacterized protein LOC131948291 [Physella acuta]XP_059165826.1 uncharacterized protein LOC131948291 [Physella acuta]XP_059165827.1 uncharacterized protein LOC131948291 [Physella acuta]
MNNILRNSFSHASKANMATEHHPRGHVYTSRISIDFVNNETGHDVTSNQETKRNQETFPSARRWAVAAVGSGQGGGESHVTCEDGADDEMMEVDVKLERRRSKRVSALISQFNSITKVAPERASSFRSVPPKLMRLGPSCQDSNLQRSQSLSTKSPALSASPDNKLYSQRQNIKIEINDQVTHKQNIPTESADKVTQKQNIPTERADKVTHRQNIPTESVDKVTHKQNIPTESVDKVTHKQNIPTERADKVTHRQNIPTESVDKVTHKQNIPAESADHKILSQNEVSKTVDKKNIFKLSVPTKIVDNKQTYKQNVPTESTNKFSNKQNIPTQPPDVIQAKHQTVANRTPQTSENSKTNPMLIKSRDVIQENVSTNLRLSFDDNVFDASPTSSYDISKVKPAVKKHMTTEWTRLRTALNTDYTRTQSESNTQGGHSESDTSFIGTRLSLPRNLNPKDVFTKENVKPASHKESSSRSACTAGQHSVDTAGQHSVDTTGQHSVDTVGHHLMDTSDIAQNPFTDIHKTPENNGPKDSVPEKSSSKNLHDDTPKSMCLHDSRVTLTSTLSSDTNIIPCTDKENFITYTGKEKSTPYSDKEKSISYTNADKNISPLDKVRIPPSDLDLAKISNSSPGEVSGDVTSRQPAGTPVEEKKSVTFALMPELQDYTAKHGLYSDPHAKSKGTLGDRAREIIQPKGRETLKEKNSSDAKVFVMYQDNNKLTMSVGSASTTRQYVDSASTTRQYVGSASTTRQCVGSASTTRQYVDSASTTRQCVGSASTTRQYVDSASTTRQCVDSASTTRQYVDSASTTRQCVDSASTTRQCVDSASTTRQYVDSASTTRQCVDSASTTRQYVDSASTTRQCADTSSGPVATHTADYSTATDRISNALNTLKTELVAMREQDLALLKQLINISNTIQKIHRSRVLKVSKSLSFSSSYLHPPPLHPSKRCYSTTLDRQNSASYVMDRKRNLYSYMRSSTESSLSSFDESEFDSASEFDESTTSLNSTFTNLSPELARARLRYQIRAPEVSLCLNVAEDGELTYEDILRRNVKLWKLSSSGR